MRKSKFLTSQVMREVQGSLLVRRSFAIPGNRSIPSVRSVTREHHEPFVAAVLTPDARESLLQVPAFQKFPDDAGRPVHPWTPATLPPSMEVVVDPPKLPVMAALMRRHHLVERCVDRSVVPVKLAGSANVQRLTSSPSIRLLHLSVSQMAGRAT